MKEYLEYIREDEFLDFVDDNDGNKIIESFNSKEDLVSVEEEIKNYKSLFNKYPKSKEPLKIKFKNVMLDNIDITFKKDYINHKISVEDFVIKYYNNNGYNAFFAENNYWIVLFLILYFDQEFIELSFPVEQAFITAIHNDERIARMERMDINSIDNIPNLINHVSEVYIKNLSHFQEVKEVVGWDNSIKGLEKFFSLDQLTVPFYHLTNEQLKIIFKRMADSFKHYTSGFPDLIVFNNDEFFFVEVKSKGDIPSFKQMQWHKFLSEVVGIDVVLFMIDKTNKQLEKIKNNYNIELKHSEKIKIKLEEGKFKFHIDWNDDKLKQHIFQVNDKEFMNLIYSRRDNIMSYKKYVVNDYTLLSIDNFGNLNDWINYKKVNIARKNDFVYKKARKLYYSHSFEDYTSTKLQLERNKQAKLFENNGEYIMAIELYMENVIEKTSSPTTYKRLVHILNKFNRFEDIVKLMDIAIPIFIRLNDKNNSLRFIYQKFAAMNKNKTMPIINSLSNNNLKFKQNKNKDKQTDLSIYFYV